METQQECLKVDIRWLIRRDIPAVLAIEQVSFSDAWTEDDLMNHLRQRNCIGMVAEIDEKIVAFFVYELYEKSLNLINIAVQPSYRKIGRAHV